MFGSRLIPGTRGSRVGYFGGATLNTEINDNPSLDLWQRGWGVCEYWFYEGIRALSLSLPLSRPTIEILHPCLGQPRRTKNIRPDFKANRAYGIER